MSDTISEIITEAYRRRSEDWNTSAATLKNRLRSRVREALAEDDPSRITIGALRIKEQERALDKARRKIAADPQMTIESVGDLEECITDLVGLKVLCKSPRDQAIMRSILCGLGTVDGFKVIEQLDYAAEPKPSGYRAHHALIEVFGFGERPVMVEVQVKTRLQDAWGELTHEDLYKPGAALRPTRFHGAVARQMAALLACVDDLADELAEELSTLTVDSPGPESTTSGTAGPALLPLDTGSNRPRLEAKIRTTGPRFALAVDAGGRQGLVSAKSVKRALGITSFIDVSDHLSVGDVVTVEVLDDEQGTYFDLVSLQIS